MIDLSAIDGHYFHILGYGVSGRSAARALGRAGKNVSVWDDAPAKRAQAIDDGFEIASDLNAAMLVVSPGVMIREGRAHPLVAAAKDQGVPMINDVGLFRAAMPNANIIGITGTNGKSTTTAMIGHILEQAGIDVAVGGNLGVPVLDLQPEAEWFVFELSSYQLELCGQLNANIALLMNITPDHIDHHGTMEAYKAAKMHVFDGAGVSIHAEALDYKSGTFETFDLTHLERLKGEHNWQNVAAAFAVCRAAGLDDEIIWQGVQSFPGLPHRQFLVRRIGNVDYINDSKATNADAAQKALRSFDNIHVILGGLPKEGGLNGLEQDFGAVRHAYLIGQAQNEFAHWLKDHGIAFDRCGTLDKAVALAHKNAQGESAPATVLLSPACASWDQFQSFEQRGTLFEELVNAL